MRDAEREARRPVAAARGDRFGPQHLAAALPHQAIRRAIHHQRHVGRIHRGAEVEDPQRGDQGRISAIVDTTIMPNVDFARMTALSVGRGWRDATPDQKAQLSKEFRTLLVRTYSGAFSAVRDQTVRMRPFRGDAAADKEVVVRSEIVQPRGEPIQIDYRMSRAADSWKIFDVNVMGVWLVQTYRNQFAQEIGKGGVDGLIRSLVEKNKGAAPPMPS